MDNAFRVRDAYKCFGETQALAGADVVLQRGEWLGLLGPNGAGKTTLVRAISGRVHLERGNIDLLEASLDDASAANAVRRKLGTVPQEIALYPLLSARENLHAFGSLHGVAGRDLRDRIDWALSWTGLAERSKQPIQQFSGGMKRRLNIACSVLHRPDVILLDEPTVGVDPQSRQRIWDMLSELRTDGAALLLTTHQLDEAQSVCDRIVIMDHGKTIAAGTLAELLQQTVGTQRRVKFTLDRSAPESLRERGYSIDEENQIRRDADDLVSELPTMLEELQNAGVVVKDIRIDTPTLQAVFLHLTGRELRE